jgi:hypothetical protein
VQLYLSLRLLMLLMLLLLALPLLMPAGRMLLPLLQGAGALPL